MQARRPLGAIEVRRCTRCPLPGCALPDSSHSSCRWLSARIPLRLFVFADWVPLGLSLVILSPFPGDTSSLSFAKQPRAAAVAVRVSGCVLGFRAPFLFCGLFKGQEQCLWSSLELRATCTLVIGVRSVQLLGRSLPLCALHSRVYNQARQIPMLSACGRHSLGLVGQSKGFGTCSLECVSSQSAQ